MRSARKSGYLHPVRAFHALALLAFFGRYDGELKAALETSLGGQARWRPKDSNATIGAFGQDRSWPGLDGKPHVFGKHVTLGGGGQDRAYLQVYYRVGESGRIEVAWVGEHRRTVSRDT